jgi:hypothetical protein
MKLWKIIVIVSVAALLAACSAPTVTPQPTQSVNQPTAAAVSTVYPYPYPGPAVSIIENTAYPMPATETPMPTATVDPQLGVLKGVLLLNDKPVGDAVLFLSDIGKDSAGKEVLVSVDYNTKVRTTTNADGSFTFRNVPVQRFALVLVVVPNSFVLVDPVKEQAITVTIEAGKTVDLGTLNFGDLPIPK